VPSTQLLSSILDRLLLLLPAEPRAAKLLSDIIDSDARAGKALVERVLRAPKTGSGRDMPASGVRSKLARGAKRSAVS
jgi:hypothetical protein